MMDGRKSIKLYSYNEKTNKKEVFGPNTTVFCQVPIPFCTKVLSVRKMMKLDLNFLYGGEPNKLKSDCPNQR
jgi:hypothetical protein